MSSDYCYSIQTLFLYKCCIIGIICTPFVGVPDIPEGDEATSEGDAERVVINAHAGEFPVILLQDIYHTCHKLLMKIRRVPW